MDISAIAKLFILHYVFLSVVAVQFKRRNDLKLVPSYTKTTCTASSLIECVTCAQSHSYVAISWDSSSATCLVSDHYATKDTDAITDDVEVWITLSTIEDKGQELTIDNCLDGVTNGVYDVRSPYTGNVTSVYCDMTTDGGGWTVLQKRYDGSLDFYKTFKEYEDGFGDVNAEFWMGLKHIHAMTSTNTTELRIDLTAADGTTTFVTYQDFSVSPGPDYTLHVGQEAGTAGDGDHGLTYNNGYGFSTKDKDVDGEGGDCAERLHGGWWYYNCGYVNLNGEYATPGTQSSYDGGWGGVVYYSFKQTKSLKTTSMMFRRT